MFFTSSFGFIAKEENGTTLRAVLLVGTSFYYRPPNQGTGIALVTSNQSHQGESKRITLREGVVEASWHQHGQTVYCPLTLSQDDCRA